MRARAVVFKTMKAARGIIGVLGRCGSCTVTDGRQLGAPCRSPARRLSADGYDSEGELSGRQSPSVISRPTPAPLPRSWHPAAAGSSKILEVAFAHGVKVREDPDWPKFLPPLISTGNPGGGVHRRRECCAMSTQTAPSLRRYREHDHERRHSAGPRGRGELIAVARSALSQDQLVDIDEMRNSRSHESIPTCRPTMRSSCGRCLSRCWRISVLRHGSDGKVPTSGGGGHKSARRELGRLARFDCGGGHLGRCLPYWGVR
jgi:hypothetical protein